MPFSNQSHNLRVEIDTKHCNLSSVEVEKLESSLTPLSKVVKDFPVSDFYITVIHHLRSKDFHVKTSLVLSGKTLFTGDRDVHVHPAFERCVRKLVKKVEGYKESLGKVPEVAKQQKGTHQEVFPDQDPDARELEQAVRSGDYASFRTAILAYEEPLRKRIGRWVSRYPALDAQIGHKLALADIVEEVFLNAFERYDQRPAAVRFGDWLESQIDPSVKALLEHPDEELENINFARTLTENQAEKK